MSNIKETAKPDPILFPGEITPPDISEQEVVPQLYQVPLDALAKYGVIGIDLTIQKAAPTIFWDTATAGDTDWWMGDRTDGGGTSNDPLEIGTGLVAGTNSLWRLDKNGVNYLISSNPILYWQVSDNNANFHRIEGIVDGATYVKMDWLVRSQTYAATWHLFGYRANTGSNTTRDVLAVVGDGNIDVVFGSASKIFDQSGTGVVNFTTTIYIGPTRLVNFVRSDRATVRTALAFDGTNDIQVGSNASGATMSLFSGAATATIALAANTVTLSDTTNIVLNATTGTKIGTATSQKLGFFNAAPVVQQGATTDLGTVLSNLGLRAAGTAYPITTSGAISFTGGLSVIEGTSASNAKVGGSIFDHFADAGNSTTTETDLYSDTLPANAFGTNGDKIYGTYGGIFVSSATATRQIKIYFAGTVILDTGTLSISTSSSWSIAVFLIKVSATVVRYTVDLQTAGASTSVYNATGELTGLTLSGTNIVKITGQAAGVGAATNDIVAKLSNLIWMPAS